MRQTKCFPNDGPPYKDPWGKDGLYERLVVSKEIEIKRLKKQIADLKNHKDIKKEDDE